MQRVVGGGGAAAGQVEVLATVARVPVRILGSRWHHHRLTPLQFQARLLTRREREHGVWRVGHRRQVGGAMSLPTIDMGMDDPTTVERQFIAAPDLGLEQAKVDSML